MVKEGRMKGRKEGRKGRKIRTNERKMSGTELHNYYFTINLDNFRDRWQGSALQKVTWVRFPLSI